MHVGLVMFALLTVSSTRNICNLSSFLGEGGGGMHFYPRQRQKTRRLFYIKAHWSFHVYFCTCYFLD